MSTEKVDFSMDDLFFDEKGNKRKTKKANIAFLKDIKTFKMKRAFMVLNEAQKDGFPHMLKLEVGGKHYKTLENQLPLDSIAFSIPENANALMMKMMSYIKKISPIKTGRYLKSHIAYTQENWRLYARGSSKMIPDPVRFAKNGGAEKWIFSSKASNKNSGHTINFFNYQPYALRLERWGVTTHKKRLKRSNYGNMKGVYYRTVRHLKRKFGGQFRIKPQIVDAFSLGPQVRAMLSKSDENFFKWKKPFSKGHFTTRRRYGYPSIRFAARRNSTLRVIDAKKLKGKNF